MRNILDGVFDLFHSGHINIIKSAKSVSDCLVVAVIGTGVEEAKGMPPIYTLEERVKLVRATKWVDEVVEGSHYNMDIPFMNSHNIDSLVHGSDTVVCEIYDTLKSLGRYISLPRTSGISTSALIYRLLDAALVLSRYKKLLVTFNHQESEPPIDDHDDDEVVADRHRRLIDYIRAEGMRDVRDSDWGRLPKIPQQSLISMNRLASNVVGRRRCDTDTVVYIDGCFDVIHPGHIDLLAKAREMGTYVVVGLFDDTLIQQVRGSAFPIMSMIERAMALTGFKYVDDVIYGVPWMLEPAFLDYVKPNIIIKREEMLLNDFLIPIRSKLHWNSNNPYEYVDKGIEVVSVPMSITIDDILDRVLQKRDQIVQYIDKRLVENVNI